MKAMFNAICDRCLCLKPRCATVYIRLSGKASRYNLSERKTLCDGCRKLKRGLFMLDAKHK